MVLESIAFTSIEKKAARLSLAANAVFSRYFGGEEGIRTLVGLPPNGFQDRLVMTTSIPLRIRLLIF